MLGWIKKFFSQGHERSIKAKKQILFSFLLKGINIGIGFIQVPLILGFIGEASYGVWLTLGSVIGWFSFLDIGLGNGLRNHLTQAFTEKDNTVARSYVSSAYFAIAAVSAIMLAVFSVTMLFLDWGSILKAPVEIVSELNMLVWIVFALFCVRFVLKLIGVILTADLRPSMNNVFLAAGNILTILGLFAFIAWYQKGSITVVGLLITAPIVLVYILASIWFFSRDYHSIRPSLSFFDRNKVRSLLTLGIKFFFLQAGSIIIFATDNMIITQVLGPEFVTTYYLPQKVFGVITLGFSIIMVPMWSSFTQAHASDDVAWIKSTLKKLVKVWAGFCLLAVVLLMASPFLYKLWVGVELAEKVSFELSALVALFVCTASFSQIFLHYINGVGKVMMQLIVLVIAAGLNIPLSIYFAKHLSMGNSGVILASIISLGIFAIVMPYQTYLTLNKKSSGIWNK